LNLDLSRKKPKNFKKRNGEHKPISMEEIFLRGFVPPNVDTKFLKH
jgi:hypothetical protein